MRLSREQFFDLVELVGKAIATAWRKEADESWLDENRFGALFEAQKTNEDQFGLFNGTPWEKGNPGSENFGFSVIEKRRARRSKNDYGDSVACELWEIQRRVRFKIYTVTEGLDQLRSLCDRLKLIRFISSGWAQTLRSVMDKRCL